MKKAKEKLKISGMHCASCALNIDFDLEDLPGIISASTNYAKQETVVEFDENVVNKEKIIQQIKKTGYDATQ